MSRKPREKSQTGIYHVMLRGADRRIIFSDEEDDKRFLSIMRKVKQQSGFLLYSYCLMDNHVHLLIEETYEPLGLIFKRIGDSYVHYYNQKYELHGSLFQDRFRSEKVENEAYFLDVLRYICQNPVKAGICSAPYDYPWLGCSYVTEDSLLIDSISHRSDVGKQDFLAFLDGECSEKHIDYDTGRRLTDREAIAVICKACACEKVQDIGEWEEEHRDKAVQSARAAGVSIRQLSRLTAISKPVIERICRENGRQRKQK